VSLPAACLQVHQVSREHQEMASALQAVLPANITTALPGHLLHTSTAWVRGCVHMFAWVALQQAGQASLSAPIGQHTPIPEAVAACLQQQLAAAAASAGGVGPVDIHVIGQPVPRRYHLPASPSAADDSPLFSPGSSLTDGSGGLLAPAVALQQVSSPCLTLPDVHPPQLAAATSAMTVTLHLGAGVPQRVRVLLLTPVTGEVLVDQEHELGAGVEAGIELHAPHWDVARAADTPADDQANRASVSASTSLTFIPLHLIITTPAHKPGSQQPPQLARLHATATLLAAPPPLASELCSLYETMMQQGGAIGLDAQAVWSLHWQPLMDSICLLSTLPGTAAEATTPQEQEQSTAMLTEAAHSLQTFFDLNSMPAWHAVVSGILARLQHSAVPGTTGREGTAACNSTGPSCLSDGKCSAKPQAQPSPAAPSPSRPRSSRIRALHAWVLYCCRLLLSGFPDPEVEKEWQSDISVTCVTATDPGGLICQVGIWAANVMRAWRIGRLTGWQDNSDVLLYTLHTTDWALPLIWWVGLTLACLDIAWEQWPTDSITRTLLVLQCRRQLAPFQVSADVRSLHTVLRVEAATSLTVLCTRACTVYVRLIQVHQVQQKQARARQGVHRGSAV
jgi:hypothetical protein